MFCTQTPTPYRRPWGGIKRSKIQLFQNMVMLHIKLNRITNVATWKQIFAPTPLPPSPKPGGGVNMSTFYYFQNMAIKCSNIVENILPPLPPQPDPRVGSKSHHSTFSELDHVAYQIKWNHKYNNMVANIMPTAPYPKPPHHRPKGLGQ